MHRAFVATYALVLVTSPLNAVPARAQEAPKPAETPSQPDLKARPSQPPILLRVQLVIARYQGEKKVSSVPYSFLVTAEERMTNIRMGVEVPVPMTSSAKAEGDKPANIPTTNRYVGTNIDCRVQERGNGLFVLHLNIEVSSVHSISPGGAPTASPEMPMATDRPLFRTFKVSLDPVLRDGQTVQTVASTDPVTGEVVKIDATLNVVK